MLSAIDLDNNFCFITDKIYYKTPDLFLPPKFQPLKLPSFQVPPQMLLGFSSSLCNSFAVFDRLMAMATPSTSTLPLAPSHRREGES